MTTLPDFRGSMIVEPMNFFIDLNRLKIECQKLINEKNLVENQLCLMHSSLCIDPWHDGTGSLYHKAKILNLPNPRLDSEFIIINEEIKTWYIGEVLELIQSFYKVCRTRIMIMPARSAYSWHRDTSKRLHLALETNKDCRMVWESGSWHIPSNGQLFLTDTTLYHSAFNGHFKESRSHLVMSILDN
jgi:hypothetical protein